MVAPNANDRDPAMAATHTDGMNHSSMNMDPSSDQNPARGLPRYRQVTMPTVSSSSGGTTLAR